MTSKLPPPDIRVTAFGEIEPTDGRQFVIGDFYSADQLRAAVQAEREQSKKLLFEAEDLLRTARAAMMKLRLRDRGSDIGLSHEVRMFALDFSEEGRDGPGALQVRGTGRLAAWLKAVRAALD